MQFDKIHNRIGTNSDKWDSLKSLYGLSPDEAIPMWVADMDFQAPEAVTSAIREMVERGIYGYGREDDNYRAAICGWMERRHKWKVQPDSLFSVHGIVNAIALAIQAYTAPKDGIIIFSPVYRNKRKRMFLKTLYTKMLYFWRQQCTLNRLSTYTRLVRFGYNS